MILAFLLFSKSIFFDYTNLDDKKLLLDNYYIFKNFSNIDVLFTRDIFLSTPIENVPYYRPVLSLSFMIDTLVAGYSSLVFSHVMSIIYHILGTFLFFLLLQKFNLNLHVAFLLGLIFLCHPVLAQAVVWTPGRGDALLGIFTFLTLIFFIDFVEKKNLSDFIFHQLFLFITFLTKETAIVLPIVCLLFLLLKKEKDQSQYWKIVPVWIVLVFIWLMCRSMVLESSRHDYFENIFRNVFSNSPVIIQYIGKIILPIQLSVLPIIHDTTYSLGLISSLVLINLIFFFQKNISDKRLLIFGAGIFLLYLLPPMISREPSLAGHDYQFEHRLYVPLAGFLIMISVFFSDERKSFLRSLYLISGSIIVFFLILNFLHQNNFSDRISFWKNAVKTSPALHYTHVNLGAAYSSQGQQDLALIELSKALLLKPDDGNVLNELGTYYLKNGELQLAEYYLKGGIKTDSTSYTGYSNLAVVFLQKDQLDTALVFLQYALALNPNHVNTLGNLGYCYLKLNQFQLAEVFWLRALELDPYHLQSIQNLTVLYADQKRFKEAHHYARIFIKLGGNLQENFMDMILNGAQ